MPTFGLLFILVGALVLRQVTVGRATEIPGDARDFFSALLNSDTGGMQDVLSRRGTNVSVDGSGSLPSTDTPLVPGAPDNLINSGGTALVNEVEKLGNAAKGYSLGATGPDYYDCSGLIWRAMRNLRIYNGVRFTTHTFAVQMQHICERVNSPAVGDIVLWPSRHMGILVGTDKMYSARSTSKGIGFSTVSGDSGYFGSQPQYWRVK